MVMVFEIIPEHATCTNSKPPRILMLALPGLLGTLAVESTTPAALITFTVPAHVEGVAVIVMVSVLPVDFDSEIDSLERPLPEHVHGMIILFPLKPGLLAYGCTS
jgi:hypothetical protein